jgi:outer membrane immunogenic protein
MKRVAAAVAGFIASAFCWTAASAIDTQIGPRWNWSGYYVGVTAGYANTAVRWTDEFGGTTGNFYGPGTAAGITGGHNWQSGRWVYGVEGDLSWTNIFADSDDTNCFPFACQTKLNSFATLRGRLGYLVSPDLLVYATAGIITGKLHQGNFLFGTATHTATGGVFGLGLERRIAPQWTLKGEYVFAPLKGGQTCDVVVCGVVVENDKFDLHLFRIGLNRHFGATGNAANLPAPPVMGWAGFYVGVFAGYGKSQTEWTDHFLGIKSSPFDGSGGLVGFAAGHNWQMGRWVYGIEGDASFTRIVASSPGPFCLCLPAESELAHLFTFRGRVGYLILPNTLAFVTGGVALATIKHGNATEQTQVAVEPGLTIGAGLEVQAFRSWTLKGEYLFARFGETEACGFAFCFGPLTADYLQVHIVRLGLNRYF